jgi:hypothetical protein
MYTSNNSTSDILDLPIRSPPLKRAKLAAINQDIYDFELNTSNASINNEIDIYLSEPRCPGSVSY